LSGGAVNITKWLPSGAPERLKFDEFRKQPQNCSIMKSFSVLLAFILTAAAAAAQTDTNAIALPADTNAPASPPETNAVVLQAGTNAVVAPTNPVAAPTGATATNLPAGRTATPRAMSLEDCLQEALQHNFDVQFERIAPQIALYDVNAAYSGYDPTFSFSGQHSYSQNGATFQNGQHVAGSEFKANTFVSGFTGGTPWGMSYNLFGNISDSFGRNVVLTNVFLPFENTSGQIGLSVAQPLLRNFWIDPTRLNIRIAKNRLKFSEQSLRSQFITTVTAVENAYYELIYAQENVKVRQEALALAQTQLDQDRQRVQIGTMAQLDVQQDESQVAKSQADLISALSVLGTDQRELKYLLTDQYSKWFDTNIQPTAALSAPLQSFDLQESWGKGMTQRPDLVQARLDVEAQGIQLKYFQNQLYPEVDLIGTYGFNGAGQEYSDVFAQYNEGNRPFYSYGGQLSIPLSNIGPRNQYKSTKEIMKQKVLQLKQLEQRVMVQIDNQIGVARSNYEQVKAQRQARFFAEAALDAEQKKYAVGKSTTLAVLILQNTLTTDRAAEIRALADYNEALALLALYEGTTLERNRINIDVK
jgi:outer membrane protein TolC